MNVRCSGFTAVYRNVNVAERDGENKGDAKWGKESNINTCMYVGGV